PLQIWGSRVAARNTCGTPKWGNNVEVYLRQILGEAFEQRSDFYCHQAIVSQDRVDWTWWPLEIAQHDPQTASGQMIRNCPRGGADETCALERCSYHAIQCIRSHSDR